MSKCLMISGLIAGIVLVSIGATATPTACPEHFATGQAPDLVNQALTQRTRDICYAGYALVHSGLSRTPLWSAEHLTRERLEAAQGTERHNAFHPDPNLSADERAELSDYARSGFDRGHMAPSGDMPDPQSQYESFSLANMVPQDHANNTGLWERIESAVRILVRREGELYVVTGPIFRGETVQRLNGRVLVPTQIFKAIYDPHRNQAAAYLVDNTADSGWRVVSIAELQEMTGIDVFPSLSQAVRETPMALPAPRPRGRGGGERQ